MRLSLPAVALLLGACGFVVGGCAAGQPEAARDPSSAAGSSPVRETGRWVTVAVEDFEARALSRGAWQKDAARDQGPFSEGGRYFRSRGIRAPDAYRSSFPVGQGGWLTAECYSRQRKPLAQLLAVTSDPSGGDNRVLRLSSPAHTDAVVLRSSDPLPPDYRLSLRVGYADFGDGQPGRNGYHGGERAEPWLAAEATAENGFYWLAILDTVPRPHNNLWIHHHRKAVIDSDNHYPPWMEIWTGADFISSGARPVMLFVIDGRGAGSPWAGRPFRSWAAGAWQPSGRVRAADAYLPDQWYQVRVARRGDWLTMEVSGTFRYGGRRSYRARLSLAEACVWHYNRPGQRAAPACRGKPGWPDGQGWPDYLMLGDPHINFYEGQVYYDDLRLERWQQAGGDPPPDVDQAIR